MTFALILGSALMLSWGASIAVGCGLATVVAGAAALDEHLHRRWNGPCSFCTDYRSA